MCSSRLAFRAIGGGGGGSGEGDGTEPKGPTCTVCLDALRVGDRVLRLPCGHLFHEPCLKPWFRQEHVCPNCRFDLWRGKPASPFKKKG